MPVRIQWFEKMVALSWICHGIWSKETKIKGEKKKRDGARSSEVFTSFDLFLISFYIKDKKNNLIYNILWCRVKGSVQLAKNIIWKNKTPKSW